MLFIYEFHKISVLVNEMLLLYDYTTKNNIVPTWWNNMSALSMANARSARCLRAK